MCSGGGRLSSAILYLAIIAIWAGVLIPRWLRRDTAQTKAAKASLEFIGDQPVDADADDGGETQMADVDVDPGDARTGEAVRGAAEDFADDVRAAGDVRADAVTVDEAGAEPVYAGAGPGGLGGRSRVLTARRRMLMMLVTLTVVAFGIVFVKLAAWWVALPPLMLLGGYLMMLREAHRMDAEHDLLRSEALRHEESERRRAEIRAERAAAAEREAAARREEEQEARIIDISAQVKDELYDQYADESRRAVGD